MKWRVDPNLGDVDFAQPFRPGVRCTCMDPNFTWYYLDHPEPDIGHGILELHERLTLPSKALELHVVTVTPSGTSVAWWELDDGTPLGFGEVGEA